MTQDKDWDLIIKPKPNIFHLGLKELFEYKDLIWLFVKRDIVAQYKQTVLGPLWLIIQPLLSTLFFTIIFGNFAKFDTKGIPYPIFTLSGLTIWNFFSTSLGKTSSVFVSNSAIFGKVYFPRLTVPVSALISNSFTFLIQFIILLFLLVYYKFVNNYDWHINYNLLILFPVVLLLCGLFGLGCGLIISSLTTKYRDLTFLIGFGLQFVMYFSSVVFPIDKFSGKIQTLFNLNPLLHIVGMFRAIFISAPLPGTQWILYSTGWTVLVLLIGAVIFNKVEKSFMDTV
jgi:lipopolysaccharide transport system permease protein